MGVGRDQENNLIEPAFFMRLQATGNPPGRAPEHFPVVVEVLAGRTAGHLHVANVSQI
jgi:hypothetical protein